MAYIPSPSLSTKGTRPVANSIESKGPKSPLSVFIVRVPSLFFTISVGLVPAMRIIGKKKCEKMVGRGVMVKMRSI